MIKWKTNANETCGQAIEIIDEKDARIRDLEERLTIQLAEKQKGKDEITRLKYGR